MQPFTYKRPETLDEALRDAAVPGAAILAGGTTMVDLMRGDLAGPSSIVDIGHLNGLDAIETTGPVLRFGALARMADVAEDATLLHDYPALAESLQLAASAQIRNVATLGGNILQRTRCPYFRDGVSDCNKRVPGSGCSALTGVDREMALFGISDLCVANYPGDWGTALAAFDTAVELRSAKGHRTIAFADFHTPYGDDPARETVLEPGEMVVAITIQATKAGRRSTYLKVRDRQSYAYALVSAAVALEMDGDVVASARVSLGGVASKPWRSAEAEAALTGQRLTEAVGLEAGRAAFEHARPGRQNAFKVELGRRVVARAALTASSRG
jgi:xanthine dehydrogenase YagS FAD-binding subunit